ncbi:MAG TPA: porin [Usitatibacter sp.]|nr:porin [Usitatibacter sp.]
MKTKRTAARRTAWSLVLAAVVAPTAHAWEMQAGEWNLGVSGTVNGFYVNREAKAKGADGSFTTTRNSAVENGLLPAWINFKLATQVDGWDVKAHLGFAPGINDRSEIVGLPHNADPASALSPFTQVDTRNALFSLGKPAFGTVTVGRDIGLFGRDIILSDMTLLGVGGTANAAVPFNTTFGMISHGYMYVGFQPQITYRTPDLGGLSLEAGIFHPSSFAGTGTREPQFQATGSFSTQALGSPTKLWASVVTQNTSGAGSQRAEGVEAGAKVGIGPFQAVLYGFEGRGLGASTVGAQFFQVVDAEGKRQKSRGYFAQGTFQAGPTKLGLSYGENRDDKSPLCAGCQRKSPAATFGVYHAFNKYVTFTGELVHEDIKNDGEKVVKVNTLALGAILFF